MFTEEFDYDGAIEISKEEAREEELSFFILNPSSYNIFCNEQSWFSDKENTSIRNILMLQ